MSKENSFSITRLFEAPIEKVFAAWTEKQALEAWMAPTDRSCCQSKHDWIIGIAFVDS